MAMNCRRILFSIVMGVIPALPSLAQAGPYADTTPVLYGAANCAAPVTHTLNVPDSFIITDVDFGFLAEHGWRTDTNMSLTSPSGTVANLLTGPYGANRNNYSVRFDDEAGVVVDTGRHDADQLLTDPAVPVQSEGTALSVFDGEDAQGDWIISLCDVFTGSDPGTLRGIELFFEVPLELDAAKTFTVYDPAGAGLYALPGNDMLYTLTVTNSGASPADADTILLIDKLPAEIEFYNGDIDDGGPETNPVAFSEIGSGLTFTYAADVGFSNLAARPADFSACTYTPLVGYDPAVTFICFNPKGAMLSGTPDPEMSVTFRARIK